MTLVEKHIIDNNHSFFKECDRLCFASKNVYNSCLYNIKTHFEETKKTLGLSEQYKLIKSSEVYKGLPSKVSNGTLLLLNKNLKSFFKLREKGLKSGFFKYKDSVKGRCITKYEKGAISKKVFALTGQIKLSQSSITIKTKVKNFADVLEVRIIPNSNHYTIEVVYSKISEAKIESDIFAGCDIGLNNLAVVGINNGIALKLNGRPLKSINQFYNKRKAYLQSKLKGNRKTSKQIQKLSFKRQNKIQDYLHKASRILIDQIVSQNVSRLVIGKNIEWKRDIKIGKQNNQNFVNIPHAHFIEMLKYKAELKGIEVITREESYTSKCSFLDNEPIKKQFSHQGKRVKRGMFVSSIGKKINADLNGAYNILRKEIPNAFCNGIEGVAVHPRTLVLKK